MECGGSDCISRLAHNRQLQSKVGRLIELLREISHSLGGSIRLPSGGMPGIGTYLTNFLTLGLKFPYESVEHVRIQGKRGIVPFFRRQEAMCLRACNIADMTDIIVTADNACRREFPVP